MKNYTHPKDFKSIRVKVDQKDWTFITVSFEIFQDITNPFWTGKLRISDTQNRVMFDKITQGSLVDIYIEDRTTKQHFQFIIYKMNRDLIKQHHYEYEFELIHISWLKDQKQRISKQYKKKQANDFVTEMIGKIGGIDFAEKTTGNYSFIVPNMSPMTAAQWAAKWGVSAVSGGADLFIYQSSHNGWSYKSLEKMIRTRSLILKNIKKIPQNIKNEDHSELEDYFISMEQYKFINHVDSIPNVMKGAFANTTLVHDIKKKNAKEVTFKYGQDIPEDAKRKPFKRFDEAPKAHITYQPIHQYNIEKKEKNFEEDHKKWNGSRKSNIMKLDTNRLLVSIPGRIDIFNQLGFSTYVELPSQQDIEISKPQDEFYKGLYIITAMRHIFNQKSFETFIELGKKRLERSL